MKKALIKVGYSCNNNCVFCHSRPLKSHPDLSTAALKARLRAARRRGAEMAVFSGGEPTLREDLPELLACARGLGLAGGVITNGRRFVYPDYAARLAESGLSFVYLSFHSADREVHRASAGTDSLHQTVAALRNVAARGIATTVNTVVTARNIKGLRAVVDLLAPARPAVLKFSVVEPKGAALDDAALLPPLREAARAIEDAVAYGRARHPGQRFACEGLTECLLEGVSALDDDLLKSGFTLFAEAFEDRFYAPDRGNRSQAPRCADCSQCASCPGVFSGYHARPQGAGLRPLSRPRSNSFVFLRDGGARALPRTPRACPARGAEPRRVYLAKGGRLLPYRTPTADFSEAEVSRALSLGQVYASRDGRHRGLDYGRDLVKLEPAPLCASCSERRACSRVLAPSPVDVFRPLEAVLERRVRSLSGRVLDVGCGTVRFRGLIEEGVRARRLSYVGIDPDLASEAAGPGLELRRVDVESFEAPAASFDHALVLRSYNHIRSPTVAFPRLHRLLKKGGGLTVVDGTPFALLLPRPPAAAGPGELQHLRNSSSGEARTLLEGFGFETVSERPVRRGGGSEWLLAMRKP